MKNLTREQILSLQQVENPLLRQRLAIYYGLPQDLQDMMFSEEVAALIGDIENRHALSKAAGYDIARIIGLTTLGEIAIKNFVPKLTEALAVDQEKAKAVAKDINEQIFQPVRESLLEVHGLTKLNGFNGNGGEPPTSGGGPVPPPPQPQSQPPAPPAAQANLPDKPQEVPPVPQSRPDEHSPTEPKSINQGPVSLEELEMRRAFGRPSVPPPTRAPSVPPASPMPEFTAKAQQKVPFESQPTAKKTLPSESPLREELLRRLRENENKKTLTKPAQEKAQGTTTAWNGRTIDLRKIPPRREPPQQSARRGQKKYIEVEVFEV